MNNSKLLETITFLLSIEKAQSIQARLDELKSALANLASQPTQPTHQTDLAAAIESLNTSLVNTRSQISPTQERYVSEIGGEPYFLADIATTVRDSIAANAATPAVASEALAAVVTEREAYIARLRQLQGDLKAIGVSPSRIAAGEAEIGFLLPREIFDNDLEGLIKELGKVRKIIRAFSELNTGSVEPIEIRQISTTDPFFTFLLAPATIIGIAKAVTWALATWKSVEEIRNLRAQTLRLSVFDESDVSKMFDSKIEETINGRIESKLEELLSRVADRNGRKQEERALLDWSLRSLLAHIERGVVVEVKVLPPPPVKAEEGKPPPPVDPAYAGIKEIAQELEFPRVEGTPILNLESPPPEPVTKSRARRAPPKKD